MTIKTNGGVFGRNPTFNNVDADSGTIKSLTSETLDVDSSNPLVNITDRVAGTPYTSSFVQSGSHLYIDNKASGSLRFRTGTAIERLNIAAGGDVTVNTGNLVIGTSGKGIDFSATSGTGTSELLNDYEEGTWTPVVADASSGGNTGTALVAQGEYTKVGNLVYVKCSLSNIDTTGLTAGNDFFIQGLPYTAANTASFSMNIGGCSASGGVSFNGTINAVVGDNVASIRLLELASSTTLDYLLVSEINSGAADIWLSVTYQAA